MSHDILFEHPGWTPMAQAPKNCERGWSNRQWLVISLGHLRLDKGLRDRMHDVAAVRDHYRAGFAKQGMGLVECDTFEIGGVPAVRAVAKIILPPVGAAYAGTIAMPLPRESYVFNVIAREVGITGMRETAVMMKVSTELETRGFALIPPTDNSPENESNAAKAPIAWRNSATGTVVHWAQDAYDPECTGPCLRNMADSAEHDGMFEQHPLSRVRGALQSLTQGVRLTESLKKRAERKPWWRIW
jgi:hypothetical protein